MYTNHCVPDHPDVRAAEQFGMPEAKVLYHCKCCGGDICMGDWYYFITNGTVFCEECIDKDIAGFEE